MDQSKSKTRTAKRAYSMAAALAVWVLIPGFHVSMSWAQSSKALPPPCQVEATKFDGWDAEQMSNQWVRLTLVPQLGGRLMQVTFAGHPYLFVNPEYEGKDIPPAQGEPLGRWFNYGGDKIWPMPEGRKDEQHWAGPLSGPLDDGVYKLRVVSQDSQCEVRLQGPPDPQTGLQYSRQISIGRDSPQIRFHAVMKNVAGYPIQWSVQSVTQYDLSDAQHSGQYNRVFWAFTPVNPHSVYLNQFHVRDGLAGDPSFSIKNGLFTLHWLYLQSEVWIDSPGGWVAAVDGSTHYAMVERFHYDAGGDYPGKATVIFYKNGPVPGFDKEGMPTVPATNSQDTPYYMEAEINSPVVALNPGASYSFDTEWYPARMGSDLSAVTYAGAVGEPLIATAAPNGLRLSGSFGVFFAGRLVARLFDEQGVELGVVPVEVVSPLNLVRLNQQIAAPPATVRVSLHLEDDQGRDRGPLGEATVQQAGKGS
ncbi:MAG TPA: hypothetical protein VMX16_14440 [Terriglobia bacterium]|nr:hypothetical protein [Terriglobia bacterium]